MSADWLDGFDEDEQRVMLMAADLEARGQVPESIRMLAEATALHLATTGFPRALLAERIFAETARP